ncbi:ATP-dependent RNA helicase DDX19B [Hypsibius exemplaris]|uniref:RNA helicase n=1 Tax=Hypsibius exemplaris TaxID=2072580 RepID=A0A9X6RMA0_HYPEX|nr:ATP-dependent RNA helicase DDX19B [Hypsibius exemplaris]
MSSSLHNSLWEAAGAVSGTAKASSQQDLDSQRDGSAPDTPQEISGPEAIAKEAADASLVRKLLECKLRAFDPASLEGNEQAKRLVNSDSSWEELHVPAPIIRGLILNLGFDRPSPIQCVALDILFKGKNLIAQSQSGTGKTIAFVIGMLKQVDPSKNYPQAIVLEPTFELVLQTAEVIRKVVDKVVNVSITEAVRGNRIERGAVVEDQIIVGTPGTVLDWLTKAKAFDARKVRMFVLDEADVMIAQQGHQDQSVRIYKMMDQNVVQTALFSATYEDKVMDFAKKVVRNPEVIAVKTEDLSLESIHQYFIMAANDDEKIHALRSLYGVVTVDNAIVFCRTREVARKIYAAMRGDGHTIGILEGEMDVAARADAIRAFREGRVRLLITTNVAARGIDVQSVNLVVNFDLPVNRDFSPDFESYIHRIGRTGRFGRGGIAINLVKDERDIKIMRAIQTHFKRDIKPLDHTDTDVLEQLNQEALETS